MINDIQTAENFKNDFKDYIKDKNALNNIEPNVNNYLII